MKETQFTFIDLFAGIGGFKKALTDNGGHCIGFSEVDKDAINVYCDNFNISPDLNLGDITKITELPKHDFLTAGVPCQSWSIAGKNLGFDDARGQLWNDTLYLLKKSKPKAFIFENVKGLVDPRNKNALDYIMAKIHESGYYADYHVLNSYDYGVPQNRVRVFIVGFRDKEHFNKFKIPSPNKYKPKLGDVLDNSVKEDFYVQMNFFNENESSRSMSLSNKNGFNDYFLFNDLRNGHSTIHSWDIIDTTDRQKYICLLLLKNRRKKHYGHLDGNPLSLEHFQSLDPTINQYELDELVNLNIIKPEEYTFLIKKSFNEPLTSEELELISKCTENKFTIDQIKTDRSFKIKKIAITKIIESLKEKSIIECIEIRYDFKNTKISTGLYGINRILLPTSDIYPTMVASDSNDYITLKTIEAENHEEYREKFLKEVYITKNFRKITKSEACKIQGFPSDFKLPESRSRWMKLIGNSVSVPLIDKLCKSIVETGVFYN